jgi:hypothetical protein
MHLPQLGWGWQRNYEWFIAPMQLPQLGWGWQRNYEWFIAPMQLPQLGWGWQRNYEWFIAPMQLPQLGWGWQRYYESAAVLCVKPFIYCFIQWITNPLNDGVNKTWLLNNPIVSDFSPK